MKRNFSSNILTNTFSHSQQQQHKTVQNNQYTNNHRFLFYNFPSFSEKQTKNPRKKIIISKHKAKVESNEFLIFMCGSLFEKHEFSGTMYCVENTK